MSGMLLDASRLRHVSLGLETLSHLPVSGRKALKSLHIDVDMDVYDRYGPHQFQQHTAMLGISQALMDCRDLESFTISRNGPGLFLPQLDLSHLLHLKKCSVQLFPAPYSLKLHSPEARLELAIQWYYVTRWSKLWHKVQDHVRRIKIDGYSPLTCTYDREGVLRAWPDGITSFWGLQYLQMTYKEVQPHPGKAVVDLARLAYIPHVSLRSKGDLSVRISSGSWRVLDIQSLGTFNVAIDNAEAFIKSTDAFYFVFPSNRRPEHLSEKLGKVGADVGIKLYECHHRYSGKLHPPLTMLSNQERVDSKPDHGAF